MAQTNGSAADKFETLYGGLDAIESNAGSLGIDLNPVLQFSDDRQADAAKYVNVAYLAYASKRKPADVLPSHEQTMNLVANKLFGRSVNDVGFYQLMSGRFAKERQSRELAGQMTDDLMGEMALTPDYTKASESVLAKYRDNAAFSKEAHEKGAYGKVFRATWDMADQKGKLYGPLIEEAETVLAGGGIEGDIDALSEKLNNLPKEDARFIVDFASIRQRKVKDVAGKQDTPATVAVAKGLARFGRATKDFAKANLEEVGLLPDPKQPFPWWTTGPIDPDQNKNAIKRRIQRHISGDLDPLKADTYFGERMYAAMDSLPYTFSAASLVGLPATFLAMKNDVRTNAIDMGVDPKEADRISYIAAVPMVAVERVASVMQVFGKVPGMQSVKTSAVKSLIKRFGVRAVGTPLSEVAEEGMQAVIPSLIQNVFKQAGADVPEAEVGQIVNDFLKNGSKDVFITALPLSLLGIASGTVQDKFDMKMMKAEAKFRPLVELQGYTTQNVDRIVNAATYGNTTDLMEAFRAARQDRNLKSTEALAARALIEEMAKRGEPVNGEETVRRSDGMMDLNKPDGEVVASGITAQQAGEAVLDGKNATEAEIVKEALDPANVRSLGDVEHETMPDRPASSPREDLEAYNKLNAEIAALPPEKRSDATMDAFNLKLSLQNRHFKGQNPSEELLPKAEPAKPKESAKTHEQRIDEPKIEPEKDGSATVPVESIQVNKAGIKAMREALDLSELKTPKEREGFGLLVNQALAEGTGDATSIAAAILQARNKGQKILVEAKDEVKIGIRITALWDGWLAKMSEAKEAFDKGNTELGEQAAAAAEKMKEEIDFLTEASDATGTNIARALGARRMQYALRTYAIEQILNRATVAKQEPLTAKEQAEFIELAARMKEAQEKIAELEAKLKLERDAAMRGNSETFVEESVKNRTKADKKDARQRRAKLKNRLKEMGYRLNDITNVVGLSVEAASIVAEIAKTHIQEAGSDIKLHEVVGKLKAEIPDLSDQDIYNALGGRIKKANEGIKDEVQNKIKELEKQANLWAKIHDALAKKFDEKAPEKITSDHIKDLQEIFTQLRLQANKTVKDSAQLKHLEEKLVAIQDQLVKGYRTVEVDGKKRVEAVPPDIKAIKEQIRELETLMRTQDAIEHLKAQYRGDELLLVSPSERVSIESEAILNARAERRRWKRAVDNLVESKRKRSKFERTLDILLVPRALQSTLDLGSLMRQGGALAWRMLLTQPKDLGLAVKQGIKSYPSLEEYDRAMAAIESHPNFQRIMRLGLELSELNGNPNNHEEHWMSNAAEKIPYWGAVVRGGARSMNAHLNLMRFSLANNFLEAYPDATDEQIRGRNDAINKFTGKGNLGSAKQATRLLNVFFYAPKLAISRYQVFALPFKYANDEKLRKELAIDFGAWALGVGALYTAASFAGLAVSTDPDDPDFLRIKAGKTSYDPLHGFQQPIRIFFLTLKHGGYRAGINKQPNTDPSEMFWRFMQYKTNPAVTLPHEVLTGHDFLGRDTTISATVARSIAPLIFQDMYQAYAAGEDAGAIATEAAAATIGVGVQTREPKKKKGASGEPGGGFRN